MTSNGAVLEVKDLEVAVEGKQILNGLETPVRLKLYMSQGEAVPVPLRSFARRVEDMVDEFKQEAGAKLIVEKLDPQPDSEVEDAAQLDGVEPQQLATGESFYLGVAVTQLDRKQTLSAIVPQRERQLEYDLLRAISRVAAPCSSTAARPSSTPSHNTSRSPRTQARFGSCWDTSTW